MARHHPIPSNVFAPKPSRTESKSDATTIAARAIIREEASAQSAKTDRLRALRLAHEADAPPPEAKKPAKRPARKRAAK